MSTFLLHLPEEILIFIIKQLDIKSVYNLYKTCQTMKAIILMHGVIRVCNLSLNTLATAKSLQLEMIQNLACNLYELNMCGVPDLRKTLLLCAVSKMKCLKALDVTYTKITILDFIDVYKNCSTINSISINFQFSPEIIKLPDKSLHECQEVFKNIVNVHFVIRSSLSNLPLHVLKKSSLNNLKYTLHTRNQKVYLSEGDMDTMFPFKHFCVFTLDWEDTNICQGSWQQLLPLVKLDNIEYIIMEYNTTYLIHTSPMFVNFFTENFKLSPLTSLNIHENMYGNVAIFIWNKDVTVFDKLFYNNLKKRIKTIFKCDLEIASEQPLPLSIDTQYYDWFNITPLTSMSGNAGKMEKQPEFKRKRIVPSGQILDFDKIFREHEYVKLSVYISLPGIVTLSATSSYLKKLTYLGLTGKLVRYSNEFFNILFRCCENLITLNVEAPALSPCCAPIMRSIPLNQSLKNIRLLDKRIDLKMLLSSFSQCKSLENICIIDSSTELNDLGDPAPLYQMCTNLFNLYIQAAMKKSVEKKLNTMVNSLLKNHDNMHHMNFTLFNTCDRFHDAYENNYVPYNPFVDAFNLKPIKPV